MNRCNKCKQHGGTFVGIFVGLVLGVVIAAGVVWYLNRSHSPFRDKDINATPAPTVAPGAPDSLPPKPGGKERFDFYNMLPNGSDAVPPPNTANTAPSDANNAAAGTAGAAAGAQFFLQAGAFQNKTEAENLKARLALIGFEAAVSEATLPGKGNVYRVRTGPYADKDELNQARTQMSQGGIQATLVKAAKN